MLFKRLCHGQYQQFEEINAIEYKWIKDCNNGALDEERKKLCISHISIIPYYGR